MINTQLEFGASPFVIEGSQTNFKTQWKIPEKLSYFQGHFPEQAILPAVAIIDFSIEAFGNNLKQSVQLKEIKNSKFLRPVLPGYDVEIHFSEIKEKRFKVRWLKESSLLAELDVVLA